MWETRTEGLHQSFPQQPRHTGEGASASVNNVTGITSEKFVATIARQDDGDVFAGELGNHIGGNSRRVRKGLIKMPGKLVNNAADLGSHKKLVMVGAKLFGSESGEFQFVVTVLVKTDGERLNGLTHVPSH